ncbi:MAG: tRNA (adenosine(37)-N6)-threonylcarbamoyltransferase complex ATPase subunit type 1 TsaE [Rickettsiales bacterium]|nr:tRNA (adenosine(37)-N6)-threonylcarbamoyltransferase complex ATPase subunit type 1 TsaE [Rickettsiales bacterium]
MIKIEITDIKQLNLITKKLIPIIGNKSLILLDGDLGAGKTTFVKSILQNLGYNKIVSSPTFNIMNIYEFNNMTVCHCDLYRLKSENELVNISIEDFIGNSIVFVEWPDLLIKNTSYDSINLKFELKTNNKRFIIISTKNKCKLEQLKQTFHGN